MATIKAPTMRDRVYIGTHGNVSLATGKAVLTAAKVNDVVELLDVPVGLKLVGVRVLTDGLGASVKVDIKLGDTAIATDVDVANAASQVSAFMPVKPEQRETLTATIKGGAATGELVVMPEYLAEGY